MVYRVCCVGLCIFQLCKQINYYSAISLSLSTHLLRRWMWDVIGKVKRTTCKVAEQSSAEKMDCIAQRSEPSSFT